MKKIYIENSIGCPRRTLDSANLKRYFEANDYEVVNRPEDADDIIVATCGAWDGPERDSIETIDALKKNTGRMVVTGCLGEINKPLLDKHFEGPTVPPKRLHEIDNLFEHQRSFSEFDKSNDASAFKILPYRLQTNRSNPTYLRNIAPLAKTAWRYTRHLGPATTARIIKGRVFGQKEYSLKISQGCNFKCTFCSIPKAIGRLVSRPLIEVVAEAEQAVADGYDTVTLIADEAGSFGIDNKERFLDLMDQLTAIEGLVELNLSDLNASWLVKYGEKLLQCFDRKKILRLEVPIQSGSQRIVDRMRRGYDLTEVEKGLVQLKSRCPYLHLHTHLIAGFPSETADDIERSIDFVSRISFNTGHVLMYSERPGAPATAMESKLPPQAKERSMIQYFDQLAANNYAVEFQGDRHEAIYFSLS